MPQKGDKQNFAVSFVSLTREGGRQGTAPVLTPHMYCFNRLSLRKPRSDTAARVGGLWLLTQPAARGGGASPSAAGGEAVGAPSARTTARNDGRGGGPCLVTRPQR